MSHPAIIARRFVFARLAPAGVLHASLAAAGVAGAWPDLVPEGETWGTPTSPRLHVVYAAQAYPRDTSVFPAVRIQTDPLYRVTVDGKIYDTAQLEAAERAMDALLHGASGAVAGGYVAGCVREQAVDVGPIPGPGGVLTYRIGGLYRLSLREE